MTSVGLLKRRKLGTRVLRFGCKGTDVTALQELLQTRGYHIGVEEKSLGYLTQDALRQFQRDHNLVVDGVAGPKVYALLLEEELPINRRVHIVQPEESIEQIARFYGVGVQAFTESNRIKNLYPGQRLVFFDREVWGVASEGKWNAPDLTGVFYDSSQQPPSEPVRVPVFELSLTNDEELVYIHKLLRSRKKRRETVKTIIERTELGLGVYIPWQQISRVDGSRYLKFLRMIRTKLPSNKKLFVELAPTIPRWNVLGGVDYSALNSIADRLVISLPILQQSEEVLCKDTLEKILWPILPEINSWKVLIRIPVFAVEWKVSSPEEPYGKFSYSEALTKAFRYGARLERDERDCLFYRYNVQGVQHHLRVPRRNPINRILAIINRHNLAGVIVDQLGMEDPRLWEIMRSHFRTARFNNF